MTRIEPLLLLFLGVGALGMLRWRHPGGRKLALAALVGIFLISWPPFGWVAARSLECWYSPTVPAAGDTQAIVVLAGGLLRPLPGRPEPLSAQNTYERTHYAAWLYKHWKQVPVLACGGLIERTNVPVSAVMREILVRENVPDSSAWMEDRSSTTFEDALYAAE